MSSESVAFNVQPRSTGQVLIGSSRELAGFVVELEDDVLAEVRERHLEAQPRAVVPHLVGPLLEVAIVGHAALERDPEAAVRARTGAGDGAATATPISGGELAAELAGAGRAPGFAPGQLDRWARRIAGGGPLAAVAAETAAAAAGRAGPDAGAHAPPDDPDAIPAPVFDLALQLRSEHLDAGVDVGEGSAERCRNVIDTFADGEGQSRELTQAEAAAGHRERDLQGCAEDADPLEVLLGGPAEEIPTGKISIWDPEVDHRGKKVALVGAGASGFQIAPSIADAVEHLTVEELDRIIGVLYEAGETWFPPIVRLAYR